MKSTLLLWGGLIAGPTAWFLNLETNFALASLACSGAKPALYLVSALTLIVAILGACAAWTQWHADGIEGEGERGAIHQRRRAMAFAGMALGGFAALVILAQTIPNSMLTGCE